MFGQVQYKLGMSQGRIIAIASISPSSRVLYCDTRASWSEDSGMVSTDSPSQELQVPLFPQQGAAEPRLGRGSSAVFFYDRGWGQNLVTDIPDSASDEAAQWDKKKTPSGPASLETRGKRNGKNTREIFDAGVWRNI